MVNGAQTFGIDPAAGHPERVLAFGYAPSEARRTVGALFALDQTLARLALGTRDAMVAQLRLAWWDEALERLATAPVPAQPILKALAEAGADGPALAEMATGWQQLLAPPDDVALLAFAEARAALFVAAARAAGAGDRVEPAGRGWALADLSGITADRALAERAAAASAPLLHEAAARRWSPPTRFLGALVHVALADLARRHPPGTPVRVARLAWHRLTGR